MINDFQRSSNNKAALLNIDNNALETYKKARETNRQINKDREKIIKLESDMIGVKRSLSNIENMLKEILGK